MSGSLALKAKVAKAKILELDFRRRITIVCFCLRAGGQDLGAGGYLRTSE
jgi:hypothetical protein